MLNRVKYNFTPRCKVLRWVKFNFNLTHAPAGKPHRRLSNKEGGYISPLPPSLHPFAALKDDCSVGWAKEREEGGRERLSNFPFHASQRSCEQQQEEEEKEEEEEEEELVPDRWDWNFNRNLNFQFAQKGKEGRKQRHRLIWTMLYVWHGLSRIKKNEINVGETSLLIVSCFTCA